MQYVKINPKGLIRAILFFAIGVLIFWLVYDDIDVEKIITQMDRINPMWIYISVGLNLISQYIRAIRWRMLITPMGYRPKKYNLLFATLILGFMNIVIPRGGEIASAVAVNKYEKIPFSKLLGTVTIQRITDLSILLVLFSGILFWQWSHFQVLIENSEIAFDFSTLSTKIVVSVSGVLLVGILIFILTRFFSFKKIRNKLKRLKNDFIEGFRTILKLKSMPAYIFWSVMIYVFWFLMSWVVFYAYEPTSHLTFKIAVFTFSVAAFAFLIPIQAGIGAWHFVVIQSLLIFGINEEAGMIFALLAHTFTNLIYLVFGAAGFAIMVWVNRKQDREALR